MIMRVLGIFLLVLAWTAPSLADTQHDRAALNDAMSAYADALALGHKPEAYLYARDAYKLGQKLLANSPAELAPLALQYGVAAAAWHQREARTILEEAVLLHRRAYGDPAEELITPLIELADEARRHTDGEQAYSAYRQAADLAHKYSPDGSFLEGRAVLGIGFLHRDAGDLTRALAQTRQATSLLASNAGAADWQVVADALFEQGDIAWNAENVAEAETAYEKALKLYLENNKLAMRVLALRQRLIASADARGDDAKTAYECQQYALRRPFERGWPIYVPAKLAKQYGTTGRRAIATAKYTVTASGRATDIEIKTTERVTGAEAKALFMGAYFVPEVKDGQAITATFSPPRRIFPMPGELTD